MWCRSAGAPVSIRSEPEKGETVLTTQNGQGNTVPA